ncbi:MAG: acetolactate synthase small subunit [Desulfobulbaceae bacterium]|nr:acetolactate synthase small subunit [Desulfobulbaceae bacterium]
MQTLKESYPCQPSAAAGQKVLELTVNNHPGVMSHICGLFSRRAFNMEGILCMPIGDGKLSRIWIQIAGTSQLDQIVKQLEKLEDVRTVVSHPAEHEVFAKLEEYFQGS